MAFEDTLDNPTAAVKSSASCASETNKNLDKAQPIITVRNDNFTTLFTIRLNGKNYSTWSKMILLHVSNHGKRGYLIGKVAQVEENASGFDSWCIEDSIIKGWLIKTMEPDLIYELQCKTTRIIQGGRDIASYFAEFKSVWLELDCRHPINMKCPDDVKI
ncbi:unnamed protein product [Prunus armeniaca]